MLYNLHCIVLCCLYWRVFSSDCIVGFTTSFHWWLASILSRSTTNAKIRQKVYFLAKNRKIVSSAKSRKIESFAEDLLILTLQLCLFVFYVFVGDILARAWSPTDLCSARNHRYPDFEFFENMSENLNSSQISWSILIVDFFLNSKPECNPGISSNLRQKEYQITDIFSLCHMLWLYF